MSIRSPAREHLTDRLSGLGARLLTGLAILLIGMVSHGQTCEDNCPNTNDPNSAAYCISYDVNKYECAWQITHGSPDVVVAVLDNFSTFEHPDMVGKWAHIDDKYPPSVDVNCHHGLRVSGIIAAQPDNGLCHAGVGYDTRVALYNTDGDCLQGSGGCGAIEFAAREAYEDGFRILNFSCSGTGLSTSTKRRYIDDGTVLVAGSACNGHSDSDLDGFIVAGSMQWSNDDNQWEGYNSSSKNRRCKGRDSNVDIFVHRKIGQLSADGSCSVGNSGSSGCAPQVAGVVALMRAVNPCISPQAIERIIKETAVGTVVNSDPDNFNKYLDAEAAVLAALDYVPADMVFDGASGPVSVGNLYPEGHIILEAGADVTVTGTIKMHHEKRIVVRRGARLHVDGGEITNSFCAEDWKGIFVEGNSVNPTAPEDAGLTFVPQATDPFGPLVADQPGILILNNGATIRQARFGAEMTAYWYDYQWPVSNNYYGGLLYADGANFIGCTVRGPLFADYDHEQSLVNDCTFDGNVVGIAMWNNRGPLVTNNTFVNQSHECIVSLNSGVGVRGGNIFQGDDPTFGTYAQILAASTHPGTQYVPAIGAASSETAPNQFFDYSDAIRSDGGVNANYLIIRQNEFASGKIGVRLQGENRYSVTSNEFDQGGVGVVSFATGDDRNWIEQNRIMGQERAINVVSTNDGLLFPRNCLTHNGTGIQLDRYFLPPSTYDHQLGSFNSGRSPSDNCFVFNDRDIYSDQDGIVFTYYVDPMASSSDCQRPQFSATSYYITANSSEPTVGKVCLLLPDFESDDLPKELAVLLQLRTELYDAMSEYEVIAPLSPEDQASLAYTKDKIERVEIALMQYYVAHGELMSASALASHVINDDVLLALYGAYVDHGYFDHAESQLGAMSSEVAGWTDFVATQTLWMAKLRTGVRTASADEEAMLYAAGNQSNKYAGWARGVYTALTYKSIVLDMTPPEPTNGRLGDASREEIAVSIVPNPATDIIDIRLPEVWGEAEHTLQFYMLDGRLAQTSHIQGGFIQVSVEDLPIGVYLLTVSKQDQVVHSQKLMIKR